MKARIAFTCLLASAAVGVLAMAASANNSTPGLAGAKVDNFMLIDQQGIGHQLYYYKSNPAVVIVSHQEGDKASTKTLEAIEKMRAAYEAKGVVFFALDSSGRKKPLGKLQKAKTIAVLDDDLQMVGRSLGVTTTVAARPLTATSRLAPAKTAARDRGRVRIIIESSPCRSWGMKLWRRGAGRPDRGWPTSERGRRLHEKQTQ